MKQVAGGRNASGVIACSFLAKRIEIAKPYYFGRDRDRLFWRMAEAGLTKE
jgi:hypothetical protein